MAPNVVDRIDDLSSSIPSASRLSLDPALRCLGILDGGWWPRSRDAGVELPLLVSSLNARVGAVLRLGVDARDWDDIPRRFTFGGHVVRVGRFADVNHKIIVTRGPQDHIMLLVIPPQASTASAKSALAMAATGKSSGRPEEILAASGIDNEAGANTPRAVPGDDDRPRGRGLSADAEDVRPVVIEDAIRDERSQIGRWLDDGAPSPDFLARDPN
ncbi:DUF5994 family protein [Actinoallomurus purpureus]|uniref:DUF5994 family protein n=1 Tax=Actinoallomurus purpureus TaxID=478114 RepID=UPI002093A32E|nr:DUF5994 family protein [Actinoallomurus purpureus]MCO6008439.1 DUF5994 family protein [Actinoallomurus purpureus]